MADASWDNSGAPPEKKGMPLWAKITLGCGVAFLLVLGACVAGGMYIAHRAKEDPEGFKKQVMGFALDKIRPDWEDLRAVVDHLRTPEGCKTLYAANPALASTWPTEAAFMEATTVWQKDLSPMPELTTEVLEQGGFHMNKNFGGNVELAWRPKKGPEVMVTFEGPPRGEAPRRILELKVRVD